MTDLTFDWVYFAKPSWSDHLNNQLKTFRSLDMKWNLKELCPYIRLKIDGGHFDGLVFLCMWNPH